MSISENHKQAGRAIVCASLIGLILITLASGCSSTNAATPNASSSSGGALASAQPAAPSTPEPMVSPAASASAPAAGAAASPAPLSQEHLVGIGSETVVTIHGKIVSVDRPKKQVTIEGPDGRQVTLHVYNPYNLAAAKPGEPFVAKFYEIVTIRKLRPGESLPAASVAEGIVGAVPGQTPGVAAGTRVQIVVTINAINKSKKTIEVQGPDGSLETVSVANASGLNLVKVGEKIVITSFNVVAIALETESGA